MKRLLTILFLLMFALVVTPVFLLASIVSVVLHGIIYVGRFFIRSMK